MNGWMSLTSLLLKQALYRQAGITLINQDSCLLWPSRGYFEITGILFWKNFSLCVFLSEEPWYQKMVANGRGYQGAVLGHYQK